MKPIILSGHTRAITHLQYNREGDLLFSSSKDGHPTLWFAKTGERIGTYDGHQGAVWHLDVSYFSKYLVTGSADGTARLWEVESGKCLAVYKHAQPVRRVCFQHGPIMAGHGNPGGMVRLFLTVSDQVMGQPPKIYIYQLPIDAPNEDGHGDDDDNDQLSTEPIKIIEGWCKDTRITNAAWGPLNETIICTGDDGNIVVYCLKTGKILKKIEGHSKGIRALAFDGPKQLYFMTGSIDTTAKLWATETLELLKTYDTGRSINCCSISPSDDNVIMAGGQEAIDVALTRVDPAQFSVRFWCRSLTDQLAHIGGHFGPVHTLSYSPDGKAFASGGEDGYIRIHQLDEDFFKTIKV